MLFEVINGPNLNLLGSRETSIYGAASLADVEKELQTHAQKLSSELELSFFQSNHEGEIISRIQACTAGGIILNAAAFTHTSVGIRDSLNAKKIPFIEVHISNVAAREEFRHKSYLSDIAAGVIFGFGTYGYLLALDGLFHLVNKRSN